MILCTQALEIFGIGTSVKASSDAVAVLNAENVQS